jgi:hypothetical protein
MNYILLSNKILFDNLPFVNYFNIEKHGFQIIPFIHCNALYLHQAKKKLNISAGVGLSFKSEAVAVELNYTPFIKSDKTTHGIELAFNFGSD